MKKPCPHHVPENCANCDGSGEIPLEMEIRGMPPLAPPIGEFVVWRRPLHEDETEPGVDPIPVLYPLLVVRVERRSRGDECSVMVRGYVWMTPTEGQSYKLSASGLSLTYLPQPQVAWVKAQGPSPEPGCWNWKGEPW